VNAALVTAYGNADVLEVRDVPEPRPGKGELKIRLAAASINQFDIKVRSGRVKAWFPVQFPFVLGFDGSGEVVEVGPDTSTFKVGDLVFGLIPHSHAQFAVAAATALGAVPQGLGLVEAASLPIIGLTGAQLIEEGVAPKKGDTVLVTGALGSVGRAAVYAAQALGARVIGGVRGRQVADAKKLGVESVVALDDVGAVGRLGPLAAVADTVGGDAVIGLVARLRPGGIWASVVGGPDGAKELGIKVHDIQTRPDATRLSALAKALSVGELVIPIAQRLALGRIRDAHRAVEEGTPGKVLVLP
jgi:NADPH:quinone reductase-like Zn-dependent oxidoreductase